MYYIIPASKYIYIYIYFCPQAYFCIDKFYDTTTTAKIYYTFYNILPQDVQYIDLSSTYIGNYSDPNSGYNKIVTLKTKYNIFFN